MTPTAFKIRQLEETQRHNIAEENIKRGQYIAQDIIDAVMQLLPFGLNVAKTVQAGRSVTAKAIDALKNARKKGKLPDDMFSFLRSLENQSRNLFVKGGKGNGK